MISPILFLVQLLPIFNDQVDEESNFRIDSAFARVALIQSIESNEFGKLIKIKSYEWILNEISSEQSRKKLKDAIPVPTDSGLVRVGDWYYNPSTALFLKLVRDQEKKIHINVVIGLDEKKVVVKKIIFLPDGDK